MCLQHKSFENTVTKEGIACYEQFLLLPLCFYLFGEFSAIFIKLKIVICKLYEFQRVLNLLFGKELMTFINLGAVERKLYQCWCEKARKHLGRCTDCYAFNLFPNKPWFLPGCSTSVFGNTVGKDEIARNKQFFFFSYSVFYLLGELSSIFIKFKVFVSKLFQFGRVQNLLLGKRLKPRSTPLKRNHAIMLMA